MRGGQLVVRRGRSAFMITHRRGEGPTGRAAARNTATPLSVELLVAWLRDGWRWAVLTVLVLVLGSLPALAQALPDGSSDLTAEQLRDLVRGSADVAWTGYGESRVDLPLPDVRDLGDVPGLLGGTTRTRTAWRGADDWRVDRLVLTGEVDVITSPTGTVTWNSADRTASTVVGALPVRLPRADDLTPPVLARRLVATPDVTFSRLPSRRVAGTSAAGLRIAPQNPSSTLVASVDVWVEPSSGLPLQVEVRAPDRRNPVLTTLLLDVALGDPGAERTAFTPPQDATTLTTQAPDVVSEINRLVPFLLPPALAGTPRADPAGLGGGGIGVYGKGFASYAVVPVTRGLGRDLLRAAPPDGLLPTPLVNALVGQVGQVGHARHVGPGGGPVFLLVGTVPAQTLRDALEQLREDPPEYVGPR